MTGSCEEGWSDILQIVSQFGFDFLMSFRIIRLMLWALGAILKTSYITLPVDTLHLTVSVDLAHLVETVLVNFLHCEVSVLSFPTVLWKCAART
jgi:hypothetical protein